MPVGAVLFPVCPSPREHLSHGIYTRLTGKPGFQLGNGKQKPIYRKLISEPFGNPNGVCIPSTPQPAHNAKNSPNPRWAASKPEKHPEGRSSLHAAEVEGAQPQLVKHPPSLCKTNPPRSYINIQVHMYRYIYMEDV